MCSFCLVHQVRRQPPLTNARREARGDGGRRFRREVCFQLVEDGRRWRDGERLHRYTQLCVVYAAKFLKVLSTFATFGLWAALLSRTIFNDIVDKIIVPIDKGKWIKSLNDVKRGLLFRFFLLRDDWQLLLGKKRGKRKWKKSVLSCSYNSLNNLFVPPTTHTYPTVPIHFLIPRHCFILTLFFRLLAFLFSPLLYFRFYVIMSIPRFFFLKTFYLVYLLFCKPQKGHHAALPDCWPSLLSAHSLNVSHIATITEGRTYSLIWCFFHSTYILTGSAETMQVEPTWPVSSQSVQPFKVCCVVLCGSRLRPFRFPWL